MILLNLTRYLFILSLFLSCGFANAQSSGTILLVTTTEANVIIDGESFGIIQSNKPTKIEIVVGEHYLQVIATANNHEKNEIIQIDSGQQKVLKYSFEVGKIAETPKDKIAVCNLDISIPGIMSSSTQTDFQFSSYYYAFEKGDQIILNLDMKNNKGTNSVMITTYPNGNVIYSKNGFADLMNLVIQSKERSIYCFSFSSNHTFDRSATLKLTRIPISDKTKDFNSSVSWKESYVTEVIQKPQKFYINGGSNATFKGGKSRILLPLNFPKNTIKWYYEFSASRNENDINTVSESLNLAGELSSLIDNTGLLEFGINQLTQPPGSDYCDIYHLSHNNSSMFTSKQAYSYFTEATRENIKSGVIEVNCCTQETTYLGFKNPDSFNGIHIIVEVVAIIQESGYVMDHVD